MRLLLVAGFLGSGKTTLLAWLAPRLADDPAKVVVIENEAGSPGVDDRILADRGLAVREVYGGCICCTLRHNLAQTLYEVAETFAPEVILIEPSGVADPADVINTAAETGLPFERIDSVVLVDAERFERIRLVCGPFLERSIARADICLVNKVDTLDPDALAALDAELRALRPSGPLLHTAARDGVGLEPLLEQLRAAPRDHDPTPGDGPRPVTVARQVSLRFDPPVPGERLVARLVEFHGWLAGLLAGSPAPVEGHLKSRLSAGAATVLIRTTALDRPATVDGALDGAVAAAELIVNAVLVGTAPGTLARLIDAELERVRAGR